MFRRLKQPICCPHLWAHQCVALLWTSDDAVAEETLQMFCFAPPARRCAAESNSELPLPLQRLRSWMNPLEEPWKKIYHPKTRLDHPEIPQNCKSSQLCSPSSSAQCSVEIPSSLSGEATLEVCSRDRLEAVEFLKLWNVCSLTPLVLSWIIPHR